VHQEQTVPGVTPLYEMRGHLHILTATPLPVLDLWTYFNHARQLQKLACEAILPISW
jgi:hypothetical protein